MRSLIGLIAALAPAAVLGATATSKIDNVLGAAPTCEVDATGHVHVFFAANAHPSFKCTHVGTDCSCTYHPTHQVGGCMQMHSLKGDKLISLGGDCSASGAGLYGGTCLGGNGVLVAQAARTRPDHCTCNPGYNARSRPTCYIKSTGSCPLHSFTTNQTWRKDDAYGVSIGSDLSAANCAKRASENPSGNYATWCQTPATEWSTLYAADQTECVVAYAGTCANGALVAQASRTQDNQCGSCNAGHKLRTCTTYSNSRAAYLVSGAYGTGMDAGSIAYGSGGHTLEECTAACKATPACMQAVFSASNGACYPMNAASSVEDSKVGFPTNEWSSVQCFDTARGTCMQLPNTRSKNYNNGHIDTNGATYGQGGLTLQQCEDACAADSACMQAVFSASNGACYPMSAASSAEAGPAGNEWTSVHCNHDGGRSHAVVQTGCVASPGYAIAAGYTARPGYEPHGGWVGFNAESGDANTVCTGDGCRARPYTNFNSAVCSALNSATSPMACKDGANFWDTNTRCAGAGAHCQTSCASWTSTQFFSQTAVERCAALCDKHPDCRSFLMVAEYNHNCLMSNRGVAADAAPATSYRTGWCNGEFKKWWYTKN